MWTSRIWYLIALLAAGFALAGGLGLTGVRDADLQQQRAEQIQTEAAVLNAHIAHETTDQHQATQLIAADPRLITAIRGLDAAMPMHVRTSVIQRALDTVVQDQRLIFSVISSEGLLATTNTQFDTSKAPTTLDALHGKLAAGSFGAPARWLVATPVPGQKSIAVTTLSDPINALISRIHTEAKLASGLVVLQQNLPVGGTLNSVDQTVSAAALPSANPNGPSAVGDVGLAAGTHHIQRFTIPSTPGYSIALTWPVEPPTSLQSAGGPSAVITQATTDSVRLGILLGGAFLVWLIGLFLAGAGRTKLMRRLASDIRLAGSGPGLSVEPSSFPDWLRPVIDATNNATEDSRRGGRQMAESSAVAPIDPPEESIDESVDSIDESGDDVEESIDGSSDNAEESVDESSESLEDESVENLPPSFSLDTDFDNDAEHGPGLAEITADASSEVSPRQIPDAPGIDLDQEPTTLLAPFSDRQTEQQKPAHDRPQLTPSGSLSGSAFDISLPALNSNDEDDVLHEPTDAGIELPRMRNESPPRRGGSLLERLRSQSALDPEQSRPFSTGENTSIRPVSLEALAASTPDTNDEERTVIGPPPEAPADHDEQARYFHRIFDEFIAMKRACNERTDNLDYARFRSKLRRTREALMSKFDCADVRFRVYERNGKAALKASPRVED